MLTRPGVIFSVMISFTLGERGVGLGAIKSEGDSGSKISDSGSNISSSVNYVSDTSPVTDSTITVSITSG